MNKLRGELDSNTHVFRLSMCMDLPMPIIRFFIVPLSYFFRIFYETHLSNIGKTPNLRFPRERFRGRKWEVGCRRRRNPSSTTLHV